MTTETLRQRAERYMQTECISSTEYRALVTELLDALDRALRLASVPEHAQDDEWQHEYSELLAQERSRDG